MGFQAEVGIRRRHFARALAVAAIAGGAMALVPAGAGAASTTCSATALRVGSVSTPTANAAGDPCRTAASGTKKGFGAYDSLRVLGGATTATDNSGSASADILRIDDATSGLTSVRVLPSDANVSCVNGKPTVVGGSSIVATEATSELTTPDALRTPVTVPGLVYVNEADQGRHETTYRALRIATPDGDVVAGESTAGYTGNPC